MPPRLAVVAVALTLGCTGTPEQASAPREPGARQPTRPRPVDRDCRPGPVENFMAEDAQKCWYTTPAGRWRILNHNFHYNVLVMDTEASSLDMSDEVVGRLAEVHGERFEEILIYVQQELAYSPSRVRRIRRTRSGREAFDFTR